LEEVHDAHSGERRIPRLWRLRHGCGQIEDQNQQGLGGEGGGGWGISKDRDVRKELGL